MKYHIINIVDGEDPDFGRVITVVANEVKEKNSILTSNPFYNDDSKFFVFPNKNSFRKKLKGIEESGSFWNPSEDFSEEERDFENGEKVVMYFHSSLYDSKGYDETLNEGKSSKIKNFDEKISEMWEKFQKETDGKKWVSEYVEDLPKADLLKWLFEIDYLTDSDLDSCSLRNDEYQNFIEHLNEMEEESAD